MKPVSNRDCLRSTKMRQDRASGQALVEFALVAFVFVLLVMGLVDFGRAVFTYNTLSNTAREGARYAAVLRSNSGALAPPTCDNVLDHMTTLGFGLELETSTTAIAWGAYPSSVTPEFGKCNASNDWSNSPSWFPRVNDASDYQVVVKVRYSFAPITPLITAVVGNSLELEAMSSMITHY
ncbi:MAG: TadE/TadG family type IV pilus assembly protein [Bacteroidota bacterium]